MKFVLRFNKYIGEICLIHVKLDGKVITKLEFIGIIFVAVNIKTRFPVVLTVLGSKVVAINE